MVVVGEEIENDGTDGASLYLRVLRVTTVVNSTRG